MGLIARHLEALGIPTVSLSSALSITAAVNPPRAVYTDFPLGHTAGKPDDLHSQDHIIAAALNAFQDLETPGSIVTLALTWAEDDAWKDGVMRPKPADGRDNPSQHEDDRVTRFDTPQYQTAEDAELVDPNCPTCITPQPP